DVVHLVRVGGGRVDQLSHPDLTDRGLHRRHEPQVGGDHVLDVGGGGSHAGPEAGLEHPQRLVAADDLTRGDLDAGLGGARFKHAGLLEAAVALGLDQPIGGTAPARGLGRPGGGGVDPAEEALAALPQLGRLLTQLVRFPVGRVDLVERVLVEEGVLPLGAHLLDHLVRRLVLGVRLCVEAADFLVQLPEITLQHYGSGHCSSFLVSPPARAGTVESSARRPNSSLTLPRPRSRSRSAGISASVFSAAAGVLTSIRTSPVGTASVGGVASGSGSPRQPTRLRGRRVPRAASATTSSRVATRSAIPWRTASRARTMRPSPNPPLTSWADTPRPLATALTNMS